MFKLVKLKYDDNGIPSYFGWKSLPPKKEDHRLISESNFNEELEEWEYTREKIEPEEIQHHNKVEEKIKNILSEFDVSSVDLRFRTALKEGIDVTNLIEVRRYKMINGVRLKTPKLLFIYNIN